MLALHQRLHLRVRRVSTLLHLGRELREQFRPVGGPLRDDVFAGRRGRLAARPQGLQLFGGVIVLDHVHHLDGSEKRFGGDLPRPAEVAGERLEALAQPPL